jgi:hypothetical protein
LKDEIQYLKDREFKVPLTLKKRQKQFQQFDDEQASFISFKLPVKEEEKIPVVVEPSHLPLSPRHPSCRGSTVFITQPTNENLSADKQSRKSSASRRTVNPAEDSSLQLSPRRTGIVLLGGTMISDNKFRYDYSNQLEDIIKKNEMVQLMSSLLCRLLNILLFRASVL